jgi:hypothetical protein
MIQNLRKLAKWIYHLHVGKQKAQLESIGWDELKKRISDMGDFLREQLILFSFGFIYA